MVASAEALASVTGLRSDAWYLPDEPLLGFVKIPAGTFTMGSNPALDRLAYENERWSSARRQGSVELADFYIGKFEVTLAQFWNYAQENPTLADKIPADVPGNIPITNITWPEALGYARWLQGKMESSPNTPEELRSYLASGARISLPSEAEWEKAARGTDGRLFPWGNMPSMEFANYDSSIPLPVGSKPCDQCAFGLQDMSGNVWELTRSPLQAYPLYRRRRYGQSGRRCTVGNARRLICRWCGQYTGRRTRRRRPWSPQQYLSASGSLSPRYSLLPPFRHNGLVFV